MASNTSPAAAGAIWATSGLKWDEILGTSDPSAIEKLLKDSRCDFTMTAVAPNGPSAPSQGDDPRSRGADGHLEHLKSNLVRLLRQEKSPKDSNTEIFQWIDVSSAKSFISLCVQRLFAV